MMKFISCENNDFRLENISFLVIQLKTRIISDGFPGARALAHLSFRNEWNIDVMKCISHETGFSRTNVFMQDVM